MKIRPALRLALLFFVMSIGLANEPLPPPYYEYYVSGYLENTVTKKNANYTLQLFGLPNKKYFVNEWVQCKGMNRSNEKPIYLTDATGFFYLKVNNEFLFDSIKVGAVSPDKIKYGEVLFVNERDLGTVKVEYSDVENKGCTSCSSTEPTHYRIEKYLYANHNYTIKLGG